MKVNDSNKIEMIWNLDEFFSQIAYQLMKSDTNFEYLLASLDVSFDQNMRFKSII